MSYWYRYAAELVDQMGKLQRDSPPRLRGITFVDEGFIVYWSEPGNDHEIACTVINEVRKGDFASLEGCVGQRISDIEAYGFSRDADPSHITFAPADPLVGDFFKKILEGMKNAKLRKRSL